MTVRSIVRLALPFALSLLLAPSAGHAAVDPCSATLTPDSRLTIPALSFGGSLYSLVLQVDGISGDHVQVEIVDAQPATLQNCTRTAALVSDPTSGTAQVLSIPLLSYGTKSYGVVLATAGTPDAWDPSAPHARGSAKAIDLTLRTAYENNGVWVGTSTCNWHAEAASAVAGGGNAIYDEKTVATVTFKCATPVSAGFFGCTGLYGGETGVWKPLIAWLEVDYTQTSTSPGNCQELVSGSTGFVLGSPSDADRLEITDKGGNTLGYQGNGMDDVPPFPHLFVVTCPNIGTTQMVTLPGNASWLGFPAGSTFQATDKAFKGTGAVAPPTIANQISSSLTCSWDFTFISAE